MNGVWGQEFQKVEKEEGGSIEDVKEQRTLNAVSLTEMCGEQDEKC